MGSSKWHDINDPGFGFSRGGDDSPASVAESQDESPEPSSPQEHEPEVRLISAEWKPGPKGFQHNEQCFVDIKADYLKKTVRARLRGKLFGTYDGEETDLLHELEGFIDKKTGVARMEIKHLFFVNSRHYSSWCKEGRASSEYQVKGIFHSRGQNEIDSPVLRMPRRNPYVFSF